MHDNICRNKLSEKALSVQTYCYCGSIFTHTACKNNSEVVGAGEDGS